MKKLGLYLLGLFLSSLSMANSKIASATLNPLELCPQLYIDGNLAYKGDTADCKKVWQHYVKNQDYCGMALMTARGEGGQKADIEAAKRYARQMIDHTEKETELGCSQENLLAKLENKQADQLNYLELRAGVDVGHTIDLLSFDYLSEILHFATEHKMASFVKELSQEQARAFQKVWQQYNVYTKRFYENYPMPCVAADFGTLSGMQYSNPAKDNLENNFQQQIQILAQQTLNIPKASEVMALDKQLNASYKRLLELGKNNQTEPEQLINIERAWLKYQQAYLHFAQAYYANRYKKADIDLAVTASLTKTQITVLNEVSNTIKDYSPCETN